MDLITVTCVQCNRNPVTIPSTMTHVGGVCDECCNMENHLSHERAIAEARRDKWESICPHLYADTDIDRLPHPVLSTKILRWPNLIAGSPDKSATWMGLNLWGWPRTGKTRTLYLILKKAFFEGRSVKCFGPSQFAQECEMREFKTASWIRNIVSLDIIAFDDIDKCKLTKAQEDKFFAVLDARIARRAPTFFTGNTEGDRLKLQFRNGESIVARMREHSMAFYFPQQQTLKL